jgi:hypothetical protein
MAWLRLTLQGSPMTSSMITPAVSVNGYRVVAHYGDNLVPVWAGPNRVDISCQWLTRFGKASLELDVPPGAQVPVFYAAPLHQFSKGAIGFEKQRRPGLAGLIGMLALVVLVVMAISVLVAVS